jgi:hypothetical protein
MTMIWKAIVFWFLLLVVAVASGALREGLLTPRLGELRAHQIGTVIVCLVFLGLMIVFVRWTQPTKMEALAIGAAWVVATMAFETIMVRVWMGKPWSAVFADYNLLQGRLWILALATTLLGPWIATRFFR